MTSAKLAVYITKTVLKIPLYLLILGFLQVFFRLARILLNEKVRPKKNLMMTV